MQNYRITDVSAIEIFNGIWEPTIKVNIHVDDIKGSSIAPTGQSTGKDEAKELRDGGSRYGGKGCQKAVSAACDELKNCLIGMDVRDQKKIDEAMKKLDGTANLSRIGANVTSAASCAVSVAAAAACGVPVYQYIEPTAHVLPVPMIDVISGSHYSFGASSEIQEFSILPVDADSFSEAMQISRELYEVLRNNIAESYGALGQCVDAAGSFAVPIKSCRGTLDFLMQALEQSGKADRFVLGMDCAASGWFDSERQVYRFEGAERTREEMLTYYKELVRDYPIATLEDPFDENDIEGFIRATKDLGIQIVGDDFFVTNPKIMRRKMQDGAANCLLWKYNQVGTLTDAFEAAEMARKADYGIMPSERSGESEDPILADLMVGLNAGQCKSGIPVRSENTAKYNRLLEIEKELAGEAEYLGRAVLKGSR